MALAGLSWLRWVVVYGTSDRILAEGCPWRHELTPLWEFPRCGIPTVGRKRKILMLCFAWALRHGWIRVVDVGGLLMMWHEVEIASAKKARHLFLLTEDSSFLTPKTLIG